MRKLLFLLTFLVAGCDQKIDQFMEKLAGHETNSVILAREPMLLDSKSVSLHSSEPMLVVGNSSAVCLVLKTGVPLAPQPRMDKLFEEAMNGAEVTATLKMKSGEVFTLSQPGQAWAKFGHISSGDELSACLSCACGPQPAIGSQVAEVTITSSAPLKILGSYWESTNAFDQIKDN
jgi:hypothetical protein